MSYFSANSYPTKPHMVFTDEDIQDLLKSINNPHEKPGMQKAIRCLAERLAIAEKCLKIADDEGFSDKAIEAHNEWLKVCGVKGE